MTPVGRNQPCPCGSGKKYKLCCLRALESRDQAYASLRADEGIVVPAVLEFTAEFYGPYLLDEAWEDFGAEVDLPRPTPDDPLFNGLFVPWFLFEFVPSPLRRRPRRQKVPPRPLGAIYAELFPQKLTPSQLAFIKATCDAALSLFVVTGVRPGQGMDVEDLLTGARFDIVERSASTMVQPAAVLLARVLTADKLATFSGCAPVPLPPISRARVVDLRERLSGGSQYLTAGEVRERAGEILSFYHDAADAVVNPAPPKLVNTDGDALELVTMRFALRCRPQETFDRLKALAPTHDEANLLSDAEYDKSSELRAVSFDWTKWGNRIHPSWENTILGHLRIDGPLLEASVNSRRRAKRLRRLVEKRLGDAVVFESETLHPIDEALAARGPRDAAGVEAAIRREREEFEAQPAEVQAALLEFITGHWDHWIDERIPALRGQTPREAAATSDGRERLEALLADFAWRNETCPPHQRVDVRALRMKLGLPPAH